MLFEFSHGNIGNTDNYPTMPHRTGMNSNNNIAYCVTLISDLLFCFWWCLRGHWVGPFRVRGVPLSLLPLLI